MTFEICKKWQKSWDLELQRKIKTILLDLDNCVAYPSTFIQLEFLSPNTISLVLPIKTNKLHGLTPRANYTDRATAACRRSDCQLLRIKGATWSA
jgi:hypothetical protein